MPTDLVNNLGPRQSWQCSYTYYLQAQVPIILCLLIMMVYIILGAVVYSQWEGWDITDSAYFSFITLTTIGFGDFVPGQE